MRRSPYVSPWKIKTSSRNVMRLRFCLTRQKFLRNTLIIKLYRLCTINVRNAQSHQTKINMKFFLSSNPTSDFFFHEKDAKWRLLKPDSSIESHRSMLPTKRGWLFWLESLELGRKVLWTFVLQCYQNEL